jgi:hypothetical protein
MKQYKVLEMSQIVLPANFDVSKVTVAAPRTLDSGGKMAYLNYNSSSLVLQTPSMACPFGLNIYDKAGPPKYSFSLSMRGYQDNEDTGAKANPKVKAIFTALSSLDEFMIDLAVKNAKAWFPSLKNPSRDIIAAFYTPCVKFSNSKDGKQYPPDFKLNLKHKRDSTEFDCAFYDAQNKQLKGIPAEDIIVKRSDITSLAQCTGVWFAGGKFGLSWKAVQARMDKVPNVGTLGFVDDGEDDAPFESNGPAFQEPNEFGAPGKKPVVEDSDEEEEAPKKAVVESDSEEEEVAPKAPPKKTVVTKKKVVSTAGK